MRFPACRLGRALALLALLLLAASSVAHSPARAAAGTKWALLVGVDQYDSEEVSPLRYAVADVKAVGAALRDSLGFPPGNVYTMTSDVPAGLNRPTSVNVLRRLDTLARQVKPGDTFLLYFSGHGYTREGGKNYLATVDADPALPQTLERTTLPLATLREMVANIQAQQVVFIIDACRNDPEKSRAGNPNLLSRGFARDLVVAAKGAAGGIAGSAVLFACSEGERAWEWPEMGQGAFTYYLLEGMRGKAGGNGRVIMNQLAGYVQQQMARWGADRNKSQKPDLQQFGAAEIVLAEGIMAPGRPVLEPAVEVLETGATLLVETEPPGATVFVDGVEQPEKRTPCSIEVELGPARSRRVEVSVALEGYKVPLRAVTLERGKSVRLRLPPLERLRKAEPAAPQPKPGGRTMINPADGAEMVWVPPGSFTMGDDNGHPAEKPARRVTLTRGYWLYRTEVTNAQYGSFLAANPAHSKPAYWGDPRFNAAQQPVVGVSWDDAAAYSAWAGGRLSTQAEWEYAARGPEGRKYPWGDAEPGPGLAVFGESVQSGGPAPVGRLTAGASWCGALDLAGNVWEWCADWDGGTYRNSPEADPKGPSSGITRVLRGGSWSLTATYLRAAYRVGSTPGSRNDALGFRLVRTGS